MKIFYVCKDGKYYKKEYGWVDAKRFADKLTYDEAKILTDFYKDAKITK